MKKLVLLGCIFQLLATAISAQQNNEAAEKWADSVLNSLSPEQRIAQLMVMRLSSYDFKTKTPIYYDSLVTEQVKKYNIGGICVFQGYPYKLASIINNIQALAQTPVLVCIDGEWGVGMRLLDSVQALPKQMMLGAITNKNIIYHYAQLVAAQCKRLGIHVNYAPVVDVNNNPYNPVINDRSFGEDKYKVAAYGIEYMHGLQDAGVMACAKHFPGHGDVAVDSHLDLPVINKSIAQLDSLELYPFKQLFAAGVGSAMVAHLYIPSIDSAANRATSISKKNVTGLLREQLGYQGLTFTDALEMQGVKKFYPDGEASVQSIIAGNDMLCLPGDVEQTINKVKEAIAKNELSWNDINYHCKKVLLSKFRYIGPKAALIRPDNITTDLNKGLTEMKRAIAENAFTLLNKRGSEFFPLKNEDSSIAYVALGINAENELARKMKNAYHADVYFFDYKQTADSIAVIANAAKQHKRIIIGLHNYSRKPENNFGISPAALSLLQQLQQQTNSITFVFGNPYIIRNFCEASNLVACYDDDPIMQQAAADMLNGQFSPKGKLPVTVCTQLPYGSGSSYYLPSKNKLWKVDSLVENAIQQGAMPGAVIMALKDGRIAFHKAYGSFNYDNKEPVTLESVYDMASVTKMCATTIAVMKLYEEGKISLVKKLGDYLPSVKGTDKANLRIEDILLHQAGLNAFIPFYKETIDTNGVPYPRLYAAKSSDSFNIRVAENLYLRKDWNDSMFNMILKSELGPNGKYVYSDNDFIFLGKMVEAITGTSLDKYVQKNFYLPLGLGSTGFKPRTFLPVKKIAPSEQEPVFRRQLIQGDVHDPGAAMFGGVAGHAGLFSNAYDVAIIMQMLLNGGTFNGKRLLKKETIELFTAYHSNASRRGLGFDKPEKDNYKREEPYPCAAISRSAFGHTGFTGTCAWADPENNLVFVFLSNRLTPDGSNNKLVKMNVRTQIQQALYEALVKKQ